MPALVLFRRRYRIASDDLHLPALWLAGLRLFGACVVLLYLIQVEARSHRKCKVRHGFAVLLGCVAFVGAIGAVGAFIIAVDSTRGLVLQRDAANSKEIAPNRPGLFSRGTAAGRVVCVGGLVGRVHDVQTSRRRFDTVTSGGDVHGRRLRATGYLAIMLLDARGGTKSMREPLRRGDSLEVPLRACSMDDRKRLASFCHCACRIMAGCACGLPGQGARRRPRDALAPHASGKTSKGVRRALGGRGALERLVRRAGRRAFRSCRWSGSGAGAPEAGRKVALPVASPRESRQARS